MVGGMVPPRLSTECLRLIFGTAWVPPSLAIDWVPPSRFWVCPRSAQGVLSVVSKCPPPRQFHLMWERSLLTLKRPSLYSYSEGKVPFSFKKKSSTSNIAGGGPLGMRWATQPQIWGWVPPPSPINGDLNFIRQLKFTKIELSWRFNFCPFFLIEKAYEKKKSWMNRLGVYPIRLQNQIFSKPS